MANSYERANSYDFLAISIVRISPTPLYIKQIILYFLYCIGSVSSDNVTCVAAPAGREWERPRILLSGHSDGVIRVWARELVPSRSNNSTSRLV